MATTLKPPPMGAGGRHALPAYSNAEHVSTLAAAQGEPNPGADAPANQTDDYAEDLEIAKAVRTTNAASNTCGPVKGHVVYVD
ncbi:MAG: DUF2790 domain-containing protein, partial [Pseudomonas fluorescens]|nr:DUF2790 domain-containing protein [Pseudomonas fluorescens]